RTNYDFFQQQTNIVALMRILVHVNPNNNYIFIYGLLPETIISTRKNILKESTPGGSSCCQFCMWMMKNVFSKSAKRSLRWMVRCMWRLQRLYCRNWRTGTQPDMM